MLVRELRKKPENWSGRVTAIRYRWTIPLHSLEWAFDWAAYYLSRWAFLEVLEYLGVLSVLVAVVFYFAESGDRIKQKHYQAWQVINTAQGKGGSGGRLEALQELNRDGVALVGVDAAGAFLRGLRLDRASLVRSTFEAADLRDCSLRAADLGYATLLSANLRDCDLRKADLRHANLAEADLMGSNLSAADLAGADLRNADLRNSDWRGVQWQQIKAIGGANLYGIQNAPQGFIAWALAQQAVSVQVADE